MAETKKKDQAAEAAAEDSHHKESQDAEDDIGDDEFEGQSVLHLYLFTSKR